MEKKQIHKYLLKRGVKLDERVNRDNGGQYLDNFLIEFSQAVREDLINEQIGILKELKKLK
jgi:hypothetical protein